MRALPTCAATLLVTMLSLSSCAMGPSRDHSNARAALDPQESQIVLPLEAYAMNWQEMQSVNHANALIIQKCMEKKGLGFPRALQDWSSLTTMPDRRYGLWSRVDAEKNGYEMPQSPQSKMVEAQENSLGESWFSEFRTCLGAEQQLPVMAVNSSPNQSVVDRGMGDSYNAVLASDDFKAARSKWIECIESKGLALNADARVLIPQFPPAGEEQLKVAAIDVDCKENLNSVQGIADFETRNQLAYIDSHEGELKAYRDSVDKVVAQAKKVIATGAS